MTTIIKTNNMGYAIVIDGETVKTGFVSERDAKRAITSEERKYALNHDPDYMDFTAYNSAVKQVKFWLNLRSQVGETAAPEDVITADDYRSSMTQANDKIAAYKAEAEKHLSGARRWARECRINPEELP